MGMYDGATAARAEVKPAASYLHAGIHNVKFTGVDKGTGEYSTMELSFEGVDEGEVGAIHVERMFEPKSAERVPNRFNSSIMDPSQAEQFMCKLMHVIAALNPTVHKKIQDGTAKFAPSDFDSLIKLVKKILDPVVGTEVQIKLLPNGRFCGFPGFPARINKNGDLYLSTSFIGQDLTLSAYEKAQIDKANSAKPTNMAASSDLDEMRRDLEDGDNTPHVDDDDDLPF